MATSISLSTTIYRLGDGMLLCASCDASRHRNANEKQHEITVFKHIRGLYQAGKLPRHSCLEGDEASFYCLNDGTVCFVTCSSRGNRKETVQSFLEELRRDFHEMYSIHEINDADREYALIKFDRIIAKKVRFYDQNGQNPQILHLQKELHEVTNIMNQSLEDILGRGEKLENLQSQSSRLKNESADYFKKTRKLTRMALLKKYAPVAVMGATFVGGFMFYFVF
eukprot:TRINITY_DN6497_c0_g1_i1.p1 TRINITY_DN6497_c0_g1~~TRINITY_DN6497_c0_g1_i1.p1  ORF type:complete len:224 (+),score=33.36 TRINITY_DN6497_c0_g1_i1:60-731(+)